MTILDGEESQILWLAVTFTAKILKSDKARTALALDIFSGQLCYPLHFEAD